MPAVYLTPASISYLNQVILASLISAYLLQRFLRTGARGRTASDWMLLAVFVTVVLMSAAFFFEVTLIGVGTYAAVAVETGLTVLLFAVLTVAATLLSRRLIQRVNPSDSPDINARDSRLVGQRAQVVQAFVDGRGRVFVSGAEWVAEIEGAAPLAGESVIVEGFEGSKLKVRAA